MFGLTFYSLNVLSRHAVLHSKMDENKTEIKNKKIINVQVL